VDARKVLGMFEKGTKVVYEASKQRQMPNIAQRRLKISNEREICYFTKRPNSKVHGKIYKFIYHCEVIV